MKEKRIQTFVSVVKHYFEQFHSTDELVIDTPYLMPENQINKMMDYTGVIGISGLIRGVVYVTATKGLLSQVLIEIDEKTDDEDLFVDLVGEIANTIAGNARTEFGSEFHISIPFVFKDSPKSFLPKDARSFIIPIEWRGSVGEIVVCLQD